MRQSITLLCVAASACSMSHGLDGETDAGPDAVAIDAIASDVGRPPPAMQTCTCCGGATTEWPADISCDLGACDPFCLPFCEDVELDAMEVSIRNDGTAWRMGVRNDECRCETQIRCDGTIIADHVLQVEAEACGPPADFGCECTPFTLGECVMPPLDEGMWRVVNGAGQDIFGPVQVAPMDSSIEQAPPRWQSPTIDSEHFEQMAWPRVPGAARETCFTPNDDLTFGVEVEVCGSCAHSVLGSCDVSVDGRFLRVSTTDQSPTNVDDIFCESCEWRRRPCGSFVDPGTYELVVDGEERGEIVLEGGTECR